MRNYSLILFFLLILIAISCNDRDKGTVFSNLKKTKGASNRRSLTGKKISLLADFYKPYRITIHGDILYLADIGSDDGMLVTYNLLNGQTGGPYIAKGEGTGELTSISSITFQNDSILVFDSQSQNFLKGSIRDLSEQGDNSLIKSRVVKESSDMLLRLVSMDNSAYIGNALSGDSLRFRIVKDRNIVTSFGDYPPLQPKDGLSEFRFRAGVVGMLFNCDIAISKINQRMVIANRKIDLIEIYDLKSKKELYAILGPYENYPVDYLISRQGNGLPCRECHSGFSSPVVTKDAFYVLLKTEKYHTPDGWVTNLVYKFNWEGTLQEILELDQKIGEFAIHEASNKLYGFNPFSDQPIVEFSL